MFKAVIFDIQDLNINHELECNYAIKGIPELLLSLGQNNIKYISSFFPTKSLQMILNELEVDASDSLVITDSTLGCTASNDAGINCIGLLRDETDAQDLSKAYLLIESFEEIDYNFLHNEYLRSHGLPVTIATTERLIIRELSVEDVKHMYLIYQNPEVSKYIDDIDEYLENEIEKHKAYIKNVYAFYGYGLWGLFNKDDNTLVGRCGIQNNMIDGNTEIELSYLLDVNHWGKGYAAECCLAILSYAFDVLDISNIVAVIDTYNTRSIRVAESIGMSYEKEITYHDRICSLYRIRSNNDMHKHHQATKSVFHIMNKNPDTSVYSKRYLHKK